MSPNLPRRLMSWSGLTTSFCNTSQKILLHTSINNHPRNYSNWSLQRLAKEAGKRTVSCYVKETRFKSLKKLGPSWLIQALPFCLVSSSNQLVCPSNLHQKSITFYNNLVFFTSSTRRKRHQQRNRHANGKWHEYCTANNFCYTFGRAVQ